jgi:hypothetical protein
VPKVFEVRLAEHVVVGERVGWVHRDRNDRLTLVTHREYVTLSGDEECRVTSGADKAAGTLRALIASGQRPSEDLVAELALDLRVTPRTVRCLLRRGGGIEPLESPIGLTEHDYLGTFTVTGELVVADRCYVAETRPLLALATPAKPGTWHTFIRHEPLFSAVSVAMFAVHGDHLGDHDQNGHELGSFGVDSCSAVIADARARARVDLFRDSDSGTWEEGIVEDLGCFSFTAHGDGLYEARAFRRDGVATMVRASLAEPQFALFRLPKPPPAARYVEALDAKLVAGSAREYSAKAKFAVGEVVRHSKFGDGVVSTLLPDGKVTIDFRDGPRTLVHGR